MKKSVLLIVFISLLLLNVVYAGSKISIELNHQVIKTEQGSASSQDGSANLKETYDTKIIASGALSRNPEVTNDFFYNFIDGDSDWSYKYKKEYTTSGSGITSNQVATNDGSGTVNLEYIPGLSESYFSIDSDTGNFTLSLIGCLPSDDSGNPVSDYSNAIQTLKWSSTTITTGFGGNTLHEDRKEVIGYSTSNSGNCLAYIKGNVFTDTKEVNGDLWIVQVKKTDTKNEPLPFTILGMSQGSGSTTTTTTYDLTITMPRVSDDPDFNLDPLDISRPSDLDKLDISNNPDSYDFNFDVLDISRPSDLDKLDLSNYPSEEGNTIDIDYIEGDQSSPSSDLSGNAVASDLAQNKLNLQFKSMNNINSLIIQGYYIDENGIIKKLNIAQANSLSKELTPSKEKMIITQEARESIEKLFNDVKDNKGKIINFYRIQTDIKDTAQQATIKFSIDSNKFSALNSIKLIKIEDDGSESEVSVTIANKGNNKVITAEIDNFSYFIITAEPKSNTNIFSTLRNFLTKIFSFFKI
ncbi:hypothetical protein J4468_02585 [Candidatus Woesearchaeota archaeon]|nr:hypothetical protein [Candidatus Woesearchaeota archaeon]